MPRITHCNPGGADRRTGQLQIPGINSQSVAVVNPVGHKRGTMFCHHGISGFISDWISGTSGSTELPNFVADLVADGWQVIAVPAPEDPLDRDNLVGASAVTFKALIADFANDPAFGAGYKSTYLLTWDHCVTWRNNHFGVMPSVAAGFSFGGWGSCHIAINRQSDPNPLLQPDALIAHVPLTNVKSLFGFGALTTTGGDLTPTALNGITIPGWVDYGIQDVIVGYSPTGTVHGNTQPMVQAAIAAGAPLAQRTISDGVITGGTALASATGAFTSGDTGALVVAPTGVPGGTTITYVDAGHVTLSKACTNGSGLAMTFPGLGPAQNETHEWLPYDTSKIMTWVESSLDPQFPRKF